MCANAPALKIFFAHVLETDRLTSWTRSRSASQSHASRRQHSNTNKSIGTAGALTVSAEQSRLAAWFRKFINARGNLSSFRSRTNATDSTSRHGTTLQMNVHFVRHTQPSPRDSMTKPLASEYFDTIVDGSGRGSYAHNYEMNIVPTSHSSLNEGVQALPALQAPLPVEQVRSRPPPLSQVRTSWNIEGRRYMWRPWERNARVQEDARHSRWV